MAKQDFYKILGVEKSASLTEIKKAYRNLVNIYHPDKNTKKSAEEQKQAEAKFKEIQEAYEILSDETKRKQYDKFGHAAFDQQFGGGSSGFSGFDFGDIFSSFTSGFGFGGSQEQKYSRPLKGENFQAKIYISFIESILGKEISQKLTKYDQCDNCKGSGANSSSDITTCYNCQGRGMQTEVLNIPGFGRVQNKTTCSVCLGSGKNITKNCKKCRGKTIVETKEEVTIKIPAGIQDGMFIRVAGFGGPGHKGGPSGDLHLEINVRQHKHFTRSGNDIHVNMPVSIIDIINQNTVEVPSPTGLKKVKLYDYYKSGQIVNVLRAGAPDPKNPRIIGDLKVHLIFYIPEFSSRQKDDLNQVFAQINDKTKAKWLKEFQ
ncbi:DnaJ C-terminal domain-containing protein [Mesomycoplasma hyopneumoniae]|uniref:DnaJ C-terminal domain-containing protein n=1 Tax=Mesomycoplasma hyopneumoniae TaxID=2099 RepID=UPI00136AC7C7|nr:DnaJ C-terminal domain-containing protein [Mesomycoplasma hyopneumoniae]MXR44470.1 molecular chaperone DnaJ [Mesomycoplasma hyopneumoniae]MXR56989.1 molecular chaperone DnaJ [Mesomycoplasma hyopneumoniae]